VTRVVSLPGDPGLGSEVARYLGIAHSTFFSKRFPDGEVYLRLPEPISSDRVLLVQSTYPNQNDRVVELLLALEVLERYGNEVVLVAPYLAYSRQDKEFLPGEAISLRSIVRALSSAGLSALVTVDAHSSSAIREFLGNRRYINVIPVEVFAEALRTYRSHELTVVAPDQGAAERARALAEELGCNYVVVRKSRDRVTGEVTHSLEPLEGLKGVAVVFDDIVSTGGTVASIATFLTARGVKVVLAVSHALLVGNALEKLTKSGVREVHSIPTVAVRVPGVRYLELAPYLAELLKEEGVV
jgi:ribose-phosphate pyrophosphokinase